MYKSYSEASLQYCILYYFIYYYFALLFVLLFMKHIVAIQNINSYYGVTLSLTYL